MSVQTRRPLRMLGGAHKSGNPYTGEVPYTRGGQVVGSVLSGSLLVGFNGACLGSVASGGHILVYSGAGRLNTVQPHQRVAVLSSPVVFYDAGTIAGSGLVAISGMRVIGLIPSMGGLNSGTTVEPLNTQIHLEVPFTSGLCVIAPSGTPGFSFSYTTELDPSLPSD